MRVSCLSSAIALVGCGSSFSSEGGSDAGGDGDDGGGVVVVGDAGADAQDADATRPADSGTRPEAGTDAGCTSQPGAGAYVESGSGSSPPNCGTAQAPCPTIQAGIDFATQQGLAVVYVADGIYHEALTISSALTLQGGWTAAGGTWRRDCPVSAAATSVHAPSGATHVVAVSAATGQVRIDALAIVNANTAAAGQTLYGIFAKGGASLDLRDVGIDVAAGGAGAMGTAGMAAGTTPTTCGSGTGAVGGPGAAGPGAPAGSYSSSGYSSATGTVGATGLSGTDGTAPPGMGQTGGPSCVNGYLCNNFPSCHQTAYGSCGTIGTSGCGAYGSYGGNPGAGGGSSIGIFAWGVHMTLDGAPGQVTVGAGGKGGDGGGPGSPVGTGSAGTAGTAAMNAACTGCGAPNCLGLSCTYGLGGKAGGVGGNGGPGGQGGGGSGGDSYCYVTGGGGTVNSAWPSGYCSVGAAGKGGSQGSGGSEGANGYAGEHN